MPELEFTVPTRGRLRLKRNAIAGAIALLGLALAVPLSSCGSFWQNPYGTSSGGGTTATTTTLVPSVDTVAVGGSLTLTATVSPAAATGSVTFYDGSQIIDSSDLTSGTATQAASASSVGTASFTANYTGDSTYASSTSPAVTVTVTAAPASSLSLATPNVQPARTITTNVHQAAPIRATSAFSTNGGNFTAKDAEAAVVEDNGSVNLRATKLTGKMGNGRGILLLRRSPQPDGKTLQFTMTDGSIRYTCDSVMTPACAKGSTGHEQNNPATVFSVANAHATIALTDVTVTNETATETSESGTLLTAAALQPWGAKGKNGGHVTFRAEGTALKGDVVVDSVSTAALSILADQWGRGSTLEGTIDRAGSGSVSLTLDTASRWTVTGNSFVTDLTGIDVSGTDVSSAAAKDMTVNNIEGNGHCVFYTGKVNGASEAKIYKLSGGGYLAPTGTQGLSCR